MGTKTVELRWLTENLTRTVAVERAHVPGVVDAEMSRFRMVVSSALLASKVLATGLLTLSLMRFRLAPMVLLPMPHLVMPRRVCLNLR